MLNPDLAYPSKDESKVEEKEFGILPQIIRYGERD